MEKLEWKARAKVNLGLDVCRRLENGYHEVRMVMQSVDIYDELEFRLRRDPDIILSVDSRYDLGDLSSNLIFRAAKRMKEYYGIKGGIEIHLKKRIPVAAGMAGGSTDAAATMLAMNRMFELGQSREQLMELALRLGADIPFCILGGTALAEGIGEKLRTLPAPPRCVVVVVKPPIMVSTKWVYETLRVDRLTRHPDIDGMVAALEAGSLSGLAGRMENVMETVTERKYPIIADIKGMLRENGALNAVMSGSGPSIFGVFEEEEQAKEAYEYLKKNLKTGRNGSRIFVTSFYNEETEAEA
ncbi:MAG: 4-(cytidine 5'-diphospho)-2-C-methyl-D-erythritol kinase [Roseburia sp.]|nr:4-(cytidine 5'-diphospho)-2-C-methyl-D-erythritol kinase [Roseburia sp.]